MFSVEEYGTISLINTFILFGTTIAKGGLQHAVLRFNSDSQDSEKRNAYYITSIAGILANSLFFSAAIVAMYFASETVNAYFGNHLAVTSILLIALVGILAFQSIRMSLSNFFLAMEQSTQFASMQVIAKYSVLVSIVFTLVFIEPTIANFFYAMLFGELIALLCSLFLFRSRHSVVWNVASFDRALLGRMALYCIPMLGSEFTGILHAMSDRIILDMLIGKEAVGLYSAAYNIAELFNTLVALSLVVAVQPIYLKLWQEGGEKQTADFLNNVLYYCMIICPAFIWGVVAIGEDLLTLMASDQYAAGAVVIPYVITGVVVDTLSLIYAAGLYIRKRTMELFVPMVISVVINIALNFLLIPEFGLTGAAAATLLSSIALAGMLYYRGRKALKLDFPIFHLLKFVCAATAMGLLVLQISFASCFPTIVAKVVCGMILYSTIVLLIDKRSRNLVLEKTLLKYREKAND